MEASTEHMLTGHTTRKMDTTVLDCFTALTNNNEKSRIEAGVKLLEHVFVKQGNFEDEGLCSELQYTLKRLICGVASSRINAKKGFFTALVGLLTSFPFITVQDVVKILKMDLHSTNVSKSEEADIYSGHILVYGALIRSGLLLKGNAEELTQVFNGLLESGAKRSYLLIPAHMFLITLLEKIEKESFHDTVWPLLKNNVKPLAEENLEMLHFLLVARSLFPEVVKKKFLSSHIGTPEVIHENTLQTCAKLLMTVRTASDFNHPIHEEFCKQLVRSPLLVAFWEQGVDVQLEKLSESKKIITIEMFYYVLKHLEDKAQVPHLLTPRFVDMVFKSLEKLWNKLVSKNDRVCSRIHQVFVNYMITTTLKEENVKDRTILKIVKKLTFGRGGNIMFDRLTGTKVVSNLLSMLTESGVKKIADVYADVISGISGMKGGLDGEKPRPWHNKERIYASDVFARLLGHPAVLGEIEWRTEQLKFLLNRSFFWPQANEQSEAPVGGFLADALKQSFFRVLNQRMPKMEHVRTLLNTLVQHVNKMIEGGKLSLRQPLAEEVMTSWQKLIETSEYLEQNIAKGKNVMLARVFHTMFLYMGLQLLADPKLAEDALAELHSCYERAEKEQKEKKKENMENCTEEEGEPEWVEVAVDLILSLLSQSSRIPKNLLEMFFFHLCPHLTEPALGQITQVLDPTVEDNPLTNPWTKDDEKSEDDNEDNSDDNESGEGEEEEEDEDEEENEDNEDNSDDESEEEEEEEEDMTVNDKLRMELQEALGSAATQTDTESVDIDEMDEEEGRRLDEALSKVFRMNKVSKPKKNTKKQIKDDRILMHFRTRAVDLLEIYLKSEHRGTEASLASYIDIMLVLFNLLEFCIKDPHQKPLENRVRGCLKKLSSARKNISLVGLTEETIADALKRLMEKGEKTSGAIFLDMGHKVVECCTFLVKCSQKLPVKIEEHSSIIQIYKSALANFFTKRDCLLQQSLFKSVLETVWEGHWSLVPLLVRYAFDPEVRPFRQNQALYLLTIFFRNRRIRTIPELAQAVEPKLKEIEGSLSLNAIKLLESQLANSNHSSGRGVKQKFMHELLTLLLTIWYSYGAAKKGDTNIDWSTLGKVLVAYREKFDLTAEAKSSFNKLARVLNITWVPVQKEKKENMKDKFQDLKDSGEDGENMEENSDREEGEEEEEAKTTKKSKKKNKKEKKQKQRRKMENKVKKLKKQSRELRLASLSKGLEAVTFSGLKRNIEVDVGHGSESDASGSEMPNGLVNGEKHEKVHKRKSDESDDNERTHKKKKQASV